MSPEVQPTGKELVADSAAESIVVAMGALVPVQLLRIGETLVALLAPEGPVVSRAVGPLDSGRLFEIVVLSLSMYFNRTRRFIITFNTVLES